jgi:hypothetical protein
MLHSYSLTALMSFSRFIVIWMCPEGARLASSYASMLVFRFALVIIFPGAISARKLVADISEKVGELGRMWGLSMKENSDLRERFLVRVCPCLPFIVTNWRGSKETWSWIQIKAARHLIRACLPLLSHSFISTQNLYYWVAKYIPFHVENMV